MSSTPSHLLLLTTLLLLLSPTFLQKSPDGSTFLFDATLPSSTPLPPITITPGATKKLMITLTGRVDSISITFQEQPYQSDSFKLFIKTNKQMESTQSAVFQSEENLSLSLDVTKSLLILQGDKRFRISKFVREKSYDVQAKEVRREPDEDDSDTATTNIPTPPQSSKSSGSVDRTTTYFLLAGIIGGLLGLVLLIKGGIMLVRRVRMHWRKSSVLSINSRTSKGKEIGDMEVGGVTPVLGFGEHALEMMSPEYKNSLTLDDKGGTDNEIDMVHQNYQKKEFPSSLTSIESNTAKSTVASAQSLISSTGSLQNLASKKTPQLEAITEEASYVKPALTLGPLKVPPLKLEEVSSKPRGTFARKSTNSKIAPAKPPVNSQQPSKEAGSSNKIPKAQKGRKEDKQENQSQGQGQGQGQKRAVTVADIRNLVERFQREKRQEESIDVSEDEYTSKEDEGEPADYFSCMVCYKEKRSAVAEPCGHVFGCEGCTKRVISSSKGCCPLCSKKVKNCRPLHK